MGAAEKQLSLLCSEASFPTSHCREERLQCERVANREPHAASQAVPQHRGPRGSPSGVQPRCAASHCVCVTERL